MATFIMNEKRDFILNIEKRHGVHVIVIANPYLHSPQYNINRLKEDNVGKNKKASYTLIQQPELEIVRAEQPTQTIEPAVKSYESNHSYKKRETGFFANLWNTITGHAPVEPAKKEDNAITRQTEPAKARVHAFEKRNAGHRKRHGSSPATSTQRSQSSGTRRKPGQGQQRGRVIPIKPEHSAKKGIKEPNEHE
jgi:ribonuclease E